VNSAILFTIQDLTPFLAEVDKIGIGKHDEFHEMLDQLKDTYLKSDELYSESSESACQLA
jgi:hypothetical protein